METVLLKDILSRNPYPEAGDELYSILCKSIEKGRKIQIDMSGVDSIPTMFMTTSFGRAMDNFGVSRLKSAMVFKNITKVQIERIVKYINDYSEVYNVNE